MIKGRKIKITYFIASLIMLTQFVVMSVLYLFINAQLTNNIKESTINNMKTVVTERSAIIENYICEVESYLTGYSRSADVVNLLNDPSNEKLQKIAQNYTKVYGSDRTGIDGLYISDWNTNVLTHINEDAVGITMREGDSLKNLQTSIMNADGVYNTGIVVSPATGVQVIAMYKGIYDESETPIGLVGAAIYTEDLKNILNELPNNGMENVKYYLINTNTGEYIFHENEEMVGKPVEDEQMLSAWKIVKEQENGFYETETGDIYAFQNLTDRGWVFVLSDTADEIFAATNSVKFILAVICVIAEIFLALITLLMISNAMKPLNPIENLFHRMSNYDIRIDEELEQYINRNDDFGEIVRSSNILVESLKNILITLKECSVRMDNKAITLQENSINLVDCVNENIAITEELSASLESVNNSIININKEIENIQGTLVSTVDITKNSNNSSDEMLNSAKQMKDDAEKAFGNSKIKLNEIKNYVNKALEGLDNLSKINGMASEILHITEQTNLLSLNASIEAARAGEFGKGFSVVAKEIGKLADNSAKTAANIQELCEDSNSNITAVRECIENIINFVEEDLLTKFENFSNRSTAYSDSVIEIKKDIETVNGFIDELNTSVNQISQNIKDVVLATQENNDAVSVIVERNEQLALISDGTQKQSEENKELAGQLEEIVNKFTLE